MADHDHAYKLLFSHREMVADLLRGFVHEDWVEELDFSTLEKVDASFVGDDLRSRESDLVWRLRWGGDQWLYIYLLLELQSTVDPFMAVRVMTYQGLLFQTLVREKLLTPGGSLPPVLPLVLYNGTMTWGAAQDVRALVESVPGGLDFYRPQCRYLLLDEHRIAESELPALRNLVAALFRLEQSRGLDQVRQVTAALLEWLRDPEQAGLRQAFGIWLSKVLLPTRLPGVRVPEVMDLKEVDEMLAERAIDWTLEWKQKGREEGREEGMEKGLQEARTALLEQIEQRFGAVPDSIRQRVEAMGSIREIMQAAIRAAAAPSLDALGLA